MEKDVIKNETQRVNVRLPIEVYNYFKAKSARTGVSMSSLIYLSLEEYISYRKSIEELPELMAQMKQMQLQADLNKLSQLESKK